MNTSSNQCITGINLCMNTPSAQRVCHTENALLVTSTSSCESLSFQVSVQRLDSQSPGPAPRSRTEIGTEQFPEGTLANDVCVHVCDKYGQKCGSGAGMGLWLLQRRVVDPENYSDVEDANYVTIKDSKYALKSGECYSVVHFSGSDMFIFMN